jgi:hypothetical protein
MSIRVADARPVKVALASSPDTIALARWSERQTAVERLNDLTAAYREAHAKLPAWAAPGLGRIDQDGNACDVEVNWPLDPTVTPPPMGCRYVRPSLYLCREQFDFAAGVFATSAATREKARANMRAKMRVIFARLRERDKLYAELGLTELLTSPSAPDQRCRETAFGRSFCLALAGFLRAAGYTLGFGP